MSNDPDLLEEPPTPCERCDGAGGWSFTTEGPDGRDIEDNHDCHACGGTGRA